MHWCERLHSEYYLLPDLHRFGLPGKVIDKIAGKLTKRLLDRYLPAYYQSTSSAYRLPAVHTGPPVICSLTSFPARIESVWIAIESLLRQTRPPDRIVLWLARDQFPGSNLPQTLQQLQTRGLEIEFCEEDLKAHKKYLYAISKYPQAWIITFDDDLYYDRHAIENLLALKKNFPDCIVTNRAHQIRFDKEGNILPYRKWFHNIGLTTPGHAVVATGGCGTLYEMRLLHDDVCAVEQLKSLAFFADDVWLKVMALRKGTRVVSNRRYGKDPVVIGQSQGEKLVTTNVMSNGNDQQLQDLMKHYGLRPEYFRDLP